MFNPQNTSKIKNNKILRWRIDLSCFKYEIIYRPGKDNVAADSFTRAYCALTSSDHLKDIYCSLCHPGVTRLNHYIKSKNLPYSVDDVKRVCSSCLVCAELKPQYYKPSAAHLIKATQPWERINLDFK